MEITACPKCGSTNIHHGSMRDGLLPGYTSKYVCKVCGYQGMPLSFDSEEKYKKFLVGLKKSNKQNR